MKRTIDTRGKTKNDIKREICESKVQYEDINTAWKNAAYFFARLGQYSSPYNCPMCKKYHLTTKLYKQPSKVFIKKFKKWFGSKVLSYEKSYPQVGLAHLHNFVYSSK